MKYFLKLCLFTALFSGGLARGTDDNPLSRYSVEKPSHGAQPGEIIVSNVEGAALYILFTAQYLQRTEGWFKSGSRNTQLLTSTWQDSNISGNVALVELLELNDEEIHRLVEKYEKIMNRQFYSNTYAGPNPNPIAIIREMAESHLTIPFPENTANEEQVAKLNEKTRRFGVHYERDAKDIPKGWTRLYFAREIEKPAPPETKLQSSEPQRRGAGFCESVLNLFRRRRR